MKNCLQPIFATLTLLLFQTLLFGQGQENQVRKPVLYDKWITIESNANIRNASNKSGDISPNFVLIGRQWNRRIITYFFQNGTPDIAGTNEQAAIRDAMAIWSNTVDLFFLEVCNQADADISILFGAGNHGDPTPDCEPGIGAFDGVDGTLAHNMGGPDPGNNCGGQGADIHFDEDENWTDAIRANGDQPIDLVTVAAHELGHALGLFHTTISGSLMLSNYTGSHRFLGQDDIAGIRSIYGLPQTNIPITNPALICTNGTFALQDQPAGTNVNWSSNDPNGLAINPTTGAATRQNNFNGQITITATINSGCGTVNVTRIVWVGDPAITYHPPGRNPCMNNPWYSGPLFPGLTYSWSVDNANVWFTTATTNYSAAVISYNPEYFNITLTISDGICTTSTTIFSYTAGYYCQCFFDPACNGGFARFDVSPNPANNQLVISFEENEYEQELKKFSKVNYSVALIDEQGTVVSKVEASSQVYKWDTSKLPVGTYYLKISYKDFIETKRVLISH